MMEKKENIIIANKVEELPVLANRIEELAEKWELSLPLTMNLNLVLEEAVSNIIFYAFKDLEEHEIKISIFLLDNELTINIQDEGIPFDPTLKKDPNINMPAEERPIGGLGIFLISKIMDTVSYIRENKKNILILKKKI